MGQFCLPNPWVALSVIKRMKYDFLYWQHFPDFEALVEYLPKLIQQYNNKPHSALFGFTPMEVFNGMIPSKANFMALVDQQKFDRVQFNKENGCIAC